MDSRAVGTPESRFFRTRFERVSQVAPGLLLAGVIAAASTHISEINGGPAMLFALLIGMALNPLLESKKVTVGINTASHLVLRLGVAMLGVRITVGDVANVGAETYLLVVAGVAVTIVVGAALGRAFGLAREHAILSAGAVAICGASAALAIASILPRRQAPQQNTIMTVAGVTTLSTIAMIAYPLATSALGLDDRSAGIFLGATIHDVAQVIGAGYTISEVAGETAAIVKLVRVGCLLPVIVILGLMFRASHEDTTVRPPLVPWFLLAFIALVAVNSLGWVGEGAQEMLDGASQWSLTTAVAALGVKTSFRDLVSVGARPMLVLVGQTALLAVFVAAALSALQT